MKRRTSTVFIILLLFIPIIPIEIVSATEYTFGRTDQGPVTSGAGDFILGNIGTPINGNGNITSLSAYIKFGETAYAKMALYTVAGEDNAGNLLGYTETLEIPNGFNGLQTFNVITQIPVVNGTTYFIVLWCENRNGGSNNIALVYQTTGVSPLNAFYIDLAGAWGDFPATLTGETSSISYRSIYATYEVSDTTYSLTYSDITNNSTVFGTTVEISTYWNSNDTLDTYTFEWNFSETMTADSPVSFPNSTAPQYSTITKDLGTNTTKYHYIIAWRINVTTTHGTENNTEFQYFTLHAINITYGISENATLRINNIEMSNSTVITPYGEVEALAAVKAGSSFTKFDYDGTSYTNNPSTILYTTSDFMNDISQDFELVTGAGEGTTNYIKGFWFFVVLSGIVVIPCSIAFLLFRRHKK